MEPLARMRSHRRRPLAASETSSKKKHLPLTKLPILQIESLSFTFHGHELIVYSKLELNYGRRYGLLELNGCGKSTLLTVIGCQELPISDHMDIYQLIRKIEASEMSALKAVISCDEERLRLEKEAEALAAWDNGGGEALNCVYE